MACKDYICYEFEKDYKNLSCEKVFERQTEYDIIFGVNITSAVFCVVFLYAYWYDYNKGFKRENHSKVWWGFTFLHTCFFFALASLLGLVIDALGECTDNSPYRYKWDRSQGGTILMIIINAIFGFAACVIQFN